MTAPHVPKDLSLAPVGVAIDSNLQQLRPLELAPLIELLELQFDRPALGLTEEERRSRVLAAALRDVNLHGWQASIPAVGAGVLIEGGSVSLELALSPTLLSFIETGNQ
jgi:hypothetical protein